MWRKTPKRRKQKHGKTNRIHQTDVNFKFIQFSSRLQMQEVIMQNFIKVLRLRLALQGGRLGRSALTILILSHFELYSISQKNKHLYSHRNAWIINHIKRTEILLLNIVFIKDGANISIISIRHSSFLYKN